MKSPGLNKFRRIFIVLYIILVLSTISLNAGEIYASTIDKKVYLGGEIVGFEIDFDGLMISDFDCVETDSGLVKIKGPLKIGDIIKSVDGEKITDVGDIKRIINSEPRKKLYLFTVERNGALCDLTVCPLIERVSGEYKIGITVKEQINGLGTVTFVTDENKFASLGHLLGENQTNCKGSVYESVVFGVSRRENSGVGAIKGALNKKAPLGCVYENNNFGVYGEFDNYNEKEYELAQINEISTGKVQICSTISGKKEFYDAEIIKINHKKVNKDKAFTLKVTDRRLIDACGGIVQGMSGSPIIQNDKIVGALTHVFMSDSTAGYGIYAQSMIDKVCA